MKTNTYTPVFVLCKCGKPLMPTTAPKARILLKLEKARVSRLYPFTIQLNYETPHWTQPVDIRIDYGAKTHGIALVQRCETHDRAIFLGEARQRQDVKRKILVRKERRRLRRYRKTRFREPRFDNRTRCKGWTPPTITQRAEAIARIAGTLSKLAPIHSAIAETGTFDTRGIANLDDDGNAYEFGPSYIYENRRHSVLSYFDYTCQYCGTRRGVMTEEHVIPRTKGGTDAWSNLTCACKECNKRKGNLTPEEAQMRNPPTVNPCNIEFMRFCALVQSGKARLMRELRRLFPAQSVFGWQTKQNREAAGLPKKHYYDALCLKSIVEKSCKLTTTIYGIKLRRRNSRQTHQANVGMGGIRRLYNANKSLQQYRKGDLVQTPRGLAYIDAIPSSGRLMYHMVHDRRRSSITKRKVRLLESTRGVQFYPLTK